MTNKQGGELAPIVSDLKQIVQLIESAREPMAIILIYDLLDRLQEAQKPV
jgi:hypothetical protein